jgi:hypothetical protein
MTMPEHIKAWSAMQRAKAEGDLMEAERQQKRWMTLLSGQARNDAAAEQKDEREGEGEGEIDWNLVNQEAAIGVELNRKAMNLWKQQQGKGQKG